MTTFDYSGFRDAPADNILARLSELAKKQLHAEAEVARLERALKEAQQALQDIKERQVPAVMDEAEMKDFTTRDGLKIKIQEKIRGSIPEATAEQAFAWLEQHKFDNLIKREFKIEFGKDEEAWAKKFMADLAKRKRPLKFQVKRGVHPSTLCAFIAEQLAQGTDIPLDVFGVYRQRTSKVDMP